jgi:hypothetical protein
MCFFDEISRMSSFSFKSWLYRQRKAWNAGVIDAFLIAIFRTFARLFLRRRVIHIATGSDTSHFHSMLQLINTVKINEGSGFTITAYDLGLTDSDRALFARVHPDVRLVRFPFESYPPHFDITRGAGEYAWKPVIVEEVYRTLREGEFLIWLDGGNFVRRKMWLIRASLFFTGFYTRLTTGTMGSGRTRTLSQGSGWRSPATIG